MNLPFSKDAFFNVFRTYNIAVWPSQLFLAGMAICILILLFVKNKRLNWLIPILLSFLWFWMGWVYHIAFFSRINPAAYFFGIFFIFQGILFVRMALDHNQSFQLKGGTTGVIGLLVIVFALIIYPLINQLTGIDVLQSPTFGLPCPTTVFTLGVLLVSKQAIHYYIIPILWAFIGTFAAIVLGVYSDFSLMFAALIVIVFLIRDHYRKGIQKVEVHP